MFNYPFYKNYNNLPLTANLRDFIKKANRDSFNNFAKKSKETKLHYSLMNYRNYSDTFLNNKKYVEDLQTGYYLCDGDNEANNDDNEANKGNDNKIHNNKNIFFVVSTFIGGSTIIGFTIFYYKYSLLFHK
jgi:hypothetical protein